MIRNYRRHRHYRESITSAPDARDEEQDPAPLKQWCRVVRMGVSGWILLAEFPTLSEAMTYANAQAERCFVFSRDGRRRLYDNSRGE